MEELILKELFPRNFKILFWSLASLNLRRYSQAVANYRLQCKGCEPHTNKNKPIIKRSIAVQKFLTVLTEPVKLKIGEHYSLYSSKILIRRYIKVIKSDKGKKKENAN